MTIAITSSKGLVNTRANLIFWAGLLAVFLGNKFFGESISPGFQSSAYIALIVVGAIALLASIISWARSKRDVLGELDQVERTMRQEIDNDKKP